MKTAYLLLWNALVLSFPLFFSPALLSSSESEQCQAETKEASNATQLSKQDALDSNLVVQSASRTDPNHTLESISKLSSSIKSLNKAIEELKAGVPEEYVNLEELLRSHKEALAKVEQKVNSVSVEVNKLNQAVLRIETDIEPRVSVDEISQAIKLTSDFIGKGQLLEAHDHLLAAMRLAPSSPEVFKTVVAFVNKATNDDNEEFLDLAADMYSRLGSMIPFQPLDKIQDARKEYNKLQSLFSYSLEEMEAPIEEQPNQYETFLKRIRTVEKGENIPSEVSSLLLQNLRSELDTMGINLAQDTLIHSDLQWSDLLNRSLSGAEINRKWTEWRNLNKLLVAAETTILARLFAKVEKKTELWFSSSSSVISLAYKDKFNIMRNSEFKDPIERGYQIKADIIPYKQAKIPKAQELLSKVDKRIKHLERTKIWVHNKHVLEKVKYWDDKDLRGSNGKKLPPIDRLRSLAKLDDSQLIPYVQKRYQDVWQKWFDDLREDEDKLEASRLKILGDFVK